MVGAEGEAKNMYEEGKCESNCGGGVGIREEGNDGEGDGMEWSKKKECKKKEFTKMWQDPKMDALVRAY
jgi:hypothetical protein